MENLDAVWKLVKDYSVRGACTCGRCAAVPEHPEDHQPHGHTADMHFFKVAMNPELSLSKEHFDLVTEGLFPIGREVNYIHLGDELGDQGFALTLMGLGVLVGSLALLTPEILLPFLDQTTKDQMAGAGFVAVQKKE